MSDFPPVGPTKQGNVKLISEHCQMTDTGIEFGTLSFDAWLELGKGIGKISKSIMWYLGDWINYGEARWGDKYSQALNRTDYNYGTLRNASWVCNHIEMKRRKNDLTFGHHMEVAKFAPDKQDEWLEKAELEGWTARELRLEINGKGKPAVTFEEWFRELDIKKFINKGLRVEDVRRITRKAWDHN